MLKWNKLFSPGCLHRDILEMPKLGCCNFLKPWQSEMLNSPNNLCLVHFNAHTISQNCFNCNAECAYTESKKIMHGIPTMDIHCCIQTIHSSCSTHCGHCRLNLHINVSNATGCSYSCKVTIKYI